MKQLKKSEKKIICGVCAGIAEFFKIDATIVRLIMCIFTALTKGAGLILYLVAAFIMPSADGTTFRDYSDDDIDNMKSANMDEEKTSSEEQKQTESSDKGQAHTDAEFNSYFEKNE